MNGQKMGSKSDSRLRRYVGGLHLTTIKAITTVTLTNYDDTPSSDTSKSPTTANDDSFLTYVISSTNNVSSHSFGTGTCGNIRSTTTRFNVRRGFLRSGDRASCTPGVGSLIGSSYNVVVAINFLVRSTAGTNTGTGPRRQFTVISTTDSPSLSGVGKLLFGDTRSSFLTNCLTTNVDRDNGMTAFNNLTVPSIASFVSNC